LRIAAYVARRYESVTRIVLGRGATILTCPPLHDSVFVPGLLADYDLVVFNLHGLPDTPAWLGGDEMNDAVPALKAKTLASCDLRGSGVFVVNCHLGDEQDPMRAALVTAAADWIIGGAGENFAGILVPVGADVLLKWFCRALRVLRKPDKALAWAKRLAKRFAPEHTEQQRMALADALGFEIWREHADQILQAPHV